jgi:RNA polymerase-binding transcription factor DksA
MTTSKSRAIRERLLARRRELLTRYHDVLALAEEEQSAEPELVDAANEQWDLRVLSMLTDTDARSLEAVLAALQRLEAGRYGTCACCGSRIEPMRLRILPEAAECFDCAEFAEDKAPRWVMSVER